MAIGPWKFERMESAEEFAKLKGETLAEHEGYYRDNDGSWIITAAASDDDEFGGRVAVATFKGAAKRGEKWNAPDPVGMAHARLIAAAPALLSALEEVLRYRRGEGKYRFDGLTTSERADAQFDAWQEVEAQVAAALSLARDGSAS